MPHTSTMLGKNSQSSIYRRTRIIAVVLVATLLASACAPGSGGTTSSTEAGSSGSSGEGASTTTSPTAGTSEADSEIVLTCSSCEDHPTNPFGQHFHRVVLDFNEEHAGQYRIDILPSPPVESGSLEESEHYIRLALANDLPDLFIMAATGIPDVNQSGALLDIGPALEEDPEWGQSFYEGIFSKVTDDEGQVLGIPFNRDVIGIFWNSALFSEVGVEEFPETWDELAAVSQELDSAGTIPFAFDDWFVPSLVWGMRIASEAGGRDFLANEMGSGDFDAPAVVVATEWLRDYYAAGYVNSDAFSADFTTMEPVFLQGQASMLANGPWQIPATRSPNAIDSLAADVRYSPSPGKTVGVTGGNAAWMSAADPEKAEAVFAFMKYVTSTDVLFEQILSTGSYPPRAVDFTQEQESQLEPLPLALVQASGDEDATVFALAHEGAAPGFGDAWRNHWPAYVQGELTTSEFLQRLADASQR